MENFGIIPNSKLQAFIDFLPTKHARVLLPAIAFAGILAFIFYLRPNAMSYQGLHILLRLSPVLIFASMAQLFIITASDIDLGIGPFVALINAIVVTFLAESLLGGLLALAIAICAYGAMGALVHILRLPSILVTLAASFVWFGAALMILPQAGGRAPEWLISFAGMKPIFAPLPVYIAAVCGVAGYYILRVHGYGATMRGLGNNPTAVTRAGRSALRARITLYMLAGFFGVLAGLAISGLSTTGDPNVGRALTLLSIAAVIIGGSEFVGGDVSPVGAVFGTLIMLMTASTLTFLSVPSHWQFGVQGGILITVLAVRATTRRRRQ
jgi:ribose/xylose/arabinose/galactoside ABC-type transport system permease subunit